jgi:hypothetical protein
MGCRKPRIIICYRFTKTLLLSLIRVFPDKPILAPVITTTADPANVPQTPVSKTRHYDYRKEEFLGFPDFFDSNKSKEFIALLRSTDEAFNQSTPRDTDQVLKVGLSLILFRPVT